MLQDPEIRTRRQKSRLDAIYSAAVAIGAYRAAIAKCKDATRPDV